MNTKQTAVAIAAVNSLDLGAIKTKLMHDASGEGWSRAHADAVETEYRRFLTLMKLYPNEANAPLVDVDTFWHYHILDTAKYAVDCAAAFGYFLHHYPYLGMDDAAGETDRAAAGARTEQLYAATFGAAPAEPALAWCGAGTAQPADQKLAWCGSATSQKLAWCGSAIGQKLAWCGSATSQKLAWCGSATSQKLAWCGSATSAPVEQSLAWCGASTGAPVKAALAWCGASTTRRLQVSEDIAVTIESAH